MTKIQIIEAARQMLPYTAEFDHDVIRVPVRNKYPFQIELSLQQPDNDTTFHKSFYEVEFKKQYVKNVAIGWEFVNIY